MNKIITIIFYLFLLMMLVFIYLKFSAVSTYKKEVMLAVEYKSIEKIFYNDGSASINKKAVNELKKNNIYAVLFKKLTLRDYTVSGDITVLNGYEVNDLFRGQGIVNPYIWMQVNKKTIIPDHTYIFISDQNLFANLYTVLSRILPITDIKIYQDKKFRYDGDISYNYIIEVLKLKKEVLDLPLFYSKDIITKVYNSGFNIILKNPTDDDIYRSFDYNVFALIDDSRNVDDYYKFSPKTVNLLLPPVEMLKYKNRNKFRYREVLLEEPAVKQKTEDKKNGTDNKILINSYKTMINKIISNREKVIIIINKFKNLPVLEKTVNPFKKVMDENKFVFQRYTLEKKVKVNYSWFYYSAVILLLIVSFVFIILKGSFEMSSGFLLINILFCILFNKMINYPSKLFIFFSAAAQILGIQLFYSLMLNKIKEKMILKSIILLVIFQVLGILLLQELVFYLQFITSYIKSFITVFLVVNVMWGLFTSIKRIQYQYVKQLLSLVIMLMTVMFLFDRYIFSVNIYRLFYDRFTECLISFFI